MNKTKNIQKQCMSVIVPMAFAGVIAMGAMGGCSKDFLQPDPLSFFAPEETFTTEGGLLAAIAMADRHLRIMTIHHAPPGASFPLPGGDLIFTDVMAISKDDNANNKCDFSQSLTPNSGRYDADGNYIAFMWTEAYKGLKYANAIPTYIDRVTGLSEQTKNEYLGKAYFHRAFKYYNLIGHHGDVPLITKIPDKPKFSYRTCKKEAIIKKMIEDLEFAVQYVPARSDMGATTVNKAACRILLAKYYLYDGQAQKAKEQMDKLISGEDGVVYALMREAPDADLHLLPNTEQTWKVTNNVIWWLHRPENKGIAANTEAILVCPNQGAAESVINGVNYMRTLVPWFNQTSWLQTPDGKEAIQCWTRTAKEYTRNDNEGRRYDYLRAFGRGIGTYRTSEWYENDAWKVNGTFDNDDLRRSSSMGNWVVMDSFRYNDPANAAWYGKYVQRYHPSTGFDLCRHPTRIWYGWPHYKVYIRDMVSEENTSATAANTATSRYDGNVKGSVGDFYVYRFAEAYLIRAEAKFYLDDAISAADDVNEVRKRAGNTDASLYPSTVTIDDIMDERARELYLEEWRKVELSRVSYCLALYGKSTADGTTYNLADYDKQSGTDLSGGSYWYKRTTQKGMYNQQVRQSPDQWGTFRYVVDKRNHYYPIPQDVINANNMAKIAQNYGYDGYDASTPKWNTWQEAVADEEVE